MRKTDRDRITKRLNAFTADFQQYVVSQVSGAAYYFEANSEFKGFDFANAARASAQSLAERLRIFIAEERVRYNKTRVREVERSKKRKRSIKPKALSKARKR